MLLEQGAPENYENDTLDESHLVRSAGCGLSSGNRLCMVSSRTTCRLLLIMKSAILHSSQVSLPCTSVRRFALHCENRLFKSGNRYWGQTWCLGLEVTKRSCLLQGDRQQVCLWCAKGIWQAKSTAKQVLVSRAPFSYIW